MRQTEALARGGGASRRRERGRSPLEDWAVDVFYGALGATAKAREDTRGRVVVELRFADWGSLDAALERLNGLPLVDGGTG